MKCANGTIGELPGCEKGQETTVSVTFKLKGKKAKKNKFICKAMVSGLSRNFFRGQRMLFPRFRHHGLTLILMKNTTLSLNVILFTSLQLNLKRLEVLISSLKFNFQLLNCKHVLR